MTKPPWRSYCELLMHDLDAIEALMMELLDHSTILSVDPNRGQSDAVFIGFARWGWAKSDDAQTRSTPAPSSSRHSGLC